MAFFDFLRELGYDEPNVARINLRYKHIVAPHRRDFEGARVLDLGSHDGRWGYAFAEAGAASVLGIEGRSELIAEYGNYPAAPFKGKVELVCGDFVAEMDRLIAEGRQFDIVACLGIYYHTMQHYRMMLQMAAFKPKLILIDSIFDRSQKPVVALTRELTHKRMNSIAQAEGQDSAPVGWVSIPALRIMAQSVDYGVEVVRWEVEADQRKPVRDYYGKFEDRVRKTVALRPVGAEKPEGMLDRVLRRQPA